MRFGWPSVHQGAKDFVMRVCASCAARSALACLTKHLCIPTNALDEDGSSQYGNAPPSNLQGPQHELLAETEGRVCDDPIASVRLEWSCEKIADIAITIRMDVGTANLAKIFSQHFRHVTHAASWFEANHL